LSGEDADTPAVGRWRMLTIAIGAQGGVAMLQQGLPALGPTFQERFDLTVGETGALLTLAPLGVASTLFAWGVLADRNGERAVVGAGLVIGGLILLAVPLASGLWSVAAILVAAGAFAASANAGGGRAVMGWFGRGELATALSLRQMATPLGAATATALTPPLVMLGGVDAVIVSLGGYMVVSGLLAVILLRSPPGMRPVRPTAGQPSVFWDARIQRLCAGSALLTCVQLSLITYFVLFLTTRHGVSLGMAAALLAAMQVGGAVARVAAGRWSDGSLRRVAPIRQVALMMVAGCLAAAVASQGSAPVAAGVLMLAGLPAISWNGLGMTAAGELAGSARAGAAMGLHTTAMFAGGTVGPLLFGLCLELSWVAAFVVIAIPPLLSWRVLAPLDDRVPLPTEDMLKRTFVHPS
jgi:sugar phosphate permease